MLTAIMLTALSGIWTDPDMGASYQAFEKRHWAVRSSLEAEDRKHREFHKGHGRDHGYGGARNYWKGRYYEPRHDGYLSPYWYPPAYYYEFNYYIPDRPYYYNYYWYGY